MGQGAQAERAKERAGAEIAQHRGETEPADDRHHDTRGAEHDERVAVSGKIDGRCGHESSDAAAPPETTPSRRPKRSPDQRPAFARSASFGEYQSGAFDPGFRRPSSGLRLLQS